MLGVLRPPMSTRVRQATVRCPRNILPLIFSDWTPGKHFLGFFTMCLNTDPGCTQTRGFPALSWASASMDLPGYFVPLTTTVSRDGCPRIGRPSGSHAALRPKGLEQPLTLGTEVGLGARPLWWQDRGAREVGSRVQLCQRPRGPDAQGRLSSGRRRGARTV